MFIWALVLFYFWQDEDRKDEDFRIKKLYPIYHLGGSSLSLFEKKTSIALNFHPKTLPNGSSGLKNQTLDLT